MTSSSPTYERPASRDHFNVAIICALQHESNAVQEMFDELWEPPNYSKSYNDTNTYTAGRIGPHNVVLVFLSDMGGPSTAASTANLLHTWPFIGLLLVVGICGGVPLAKDGTEINLGDVVISNSIVQYTHSKRYPDGVKQNRDTVGMTPELRTFLHKLGTTRERKKLLRRSEDLLKSLLKDEDYIAFKKPESATNRVFETRYRHKHQRGTCSECSKDRDGACSKALKSTCIELGCSPKRCKIRPASTLQLHFGTILSSNEVIKSGIHRDGIAYEDDVIAFEMEGLGACLLGIPTVIVKSVSDYADSHKDKTWQNHAAAMAACASKAFLEQWARTETLSIMPDNTNSKTCEDFSYSTTAFVDTFWYREIENRYDDVEHAHLRTFRWILHCEIQDVARLLKSRTYSKLCEYTNDFVSANLAPEDWDPCGLRRWLRTGSGIFWITGKPGSGKSTLMKYIYEDAASQTLVKEWADNHPLITPAFFFWRAGSKMQRSQLGFLSSVLYQFFKAFPDLIDRVVKPPERNAALAFKKLPRDENAIYWTIEEVKRIFKRLAALSEIRVCLFVDGLDEFQGDMDYIGAFLESLTSNGNVKILLASRYTIPLRDSFQTREPIFLHDWTRQDIEEYVQDRLNTNQYVLQRAVVSRDTYAQIVTNVLDKAEGVFIWVKTAVSTLLRGFRESDTLEELQQRLQKLPTELYDLYETIVLALDKQYGYQTRLYLVLYLKMYNWFESQLSLLRFCFAERYDDTNARWMVEQYEEDYTRILRDSHKRVESRCADLIMVSFDPKKVARLTMMHRTVLDFLTTSKMQDWLALGAAEERRLDAAVCLTFFSHYLDCYRSSSSDQIHLFIWEELWGGRFRAFPTELHGKFMDQLRCALQEWHAQGLIETPNPYGKSYLLHHIWEKYWPTQSRIALLCFWLEQMSILGAQHVLENGLESLSTDIRVDCLTAAILGCQNHQELRNLAHYLCPPGSAALRLFWQHLLSMVACRMHYPMNIMEGYHWAPLYLPLIIEVLIENGADTNEILHCSSIRTDQSRCRSALSVFKAALSAGIDFDLTGRDGSAISAVEDCTKNLAEAIKILENAGAKELEVEEVCAGESRWELHESEEHRLSRHETESSS